MASPNSCSVFAMRRWQSSRPAAFAPGGAARKNKPLSAAVASAVLPNTAFVNAALPNEAFLRNVCNCIHPPWAPPWCWLGFFASLQKKPAARKNVAGADGKLGTGNVVRTTERFGRLSDKEKEAQC